MILKEIYDFLDSIAPFDSALDWDNSGFLIGNIYDQLKNALICLDVSFDILNEAISKNANLIISHHPIIFYPIKNIAHDSLAFNLIKNNINVICLHTNLDISKTGVNFALASALDLINCFTFPNLDKIGLIGFLKNPLKPEKLAFLVKQKLSCQSISFLPSDKLISKVAVCGGSGSTYISDAINNNVDAYISAEFKRHNWLEAQKANLTLIDAGHFETENPVCRHLESILNRHFNCDLFNVAESNFNIVKTFTNSNTMH